jgi:hypothetical protein
MRRRLLGSLAWLFLLFVAGTGRVVWLTLRAVASRPRTLLILGGLFVALSTSNPLAGQFPIGEAWPIGHVVLSWGAPFLGSVVLFHGFRSPWVRQVRRELRRRGW